MALASSASLFASLTVLALVTTTTVASAQQSTTRKACAEAASRGQLLRDEGKLVEARARFVTCAQPGCPPLIQKDCAEWQAGVDARLPSVTVAVKDKQGKDVAQATVTLDGQPFAQAADGRAVTIDPGKHVFRVKAAGFVAGELEAVVREGERARPISITLARVGGEPDVKREDVVKKETPVEPSGPNVLPWVLAGVGVVGVGVGAGLYFSAKSDFDGLADPATGCKPRCTDADVSPVRTKATLSYVAFGIGGAAAIASVILFATSSGSVKVGAMATPTSGAASVAGRF